MTSSQDIKATIAKVKFSNSIADENHQQMFRRLSDPIFNSGAMHGTPGTKKGKSR
jgi:hypothetical protein